MAQLYSKHQLRKIFQSPFDQEAWKAILHHLFHAEMLRKEPEKFTTTGDNEDGFYLGALDTSDSYRIGLFYFVIKTGSVAHKKVGLRNLVKKFVNPTWGEFDAALVVFDDKQEWRLSFVCDIKDVKTNPKRYTFVFGERDNFYRTAIERFLTVQNAEPTFDNIRKAFSVEALTKQFYTDLFEWFKWATNPDTGVTFPNDTSTEADDREDIETKIIRLITRIMFVWFIKQKGLVPSKIFDTESLKTILKNFDPNSASIGNYYNAILQNLFFATLNRAIVDEQGVKRSFATRTGKDIKTLYRYAELFSISEDEVIKLFSEVPFLNGGLFECLDKTKTIDGVEHAYNYDGFSRNDKKFADGRYRNRAVVPNILFFESEKGLLSILSRYNFTIEENSPEEQQVALDPELLGKVFENLLGAYNPETKETARNQSGSFYTPREIVNYMVDESLISYLGNTPFVRSLFSPEFVYDDTKGADYKIIVDKLKAIKILDPACGSGAFPMGILNRITDIICRISPDIDTYHAKLNIIENCIYGSDIQSIAIQITKLRFFISLICHCEKDASKPNFGIPTLPNLETKFVAANSLISKKIKERQLDLFTNQEIEPTKKALIEVRHEHFLAKTAHKKSELRKKDQQLRVKLAKLLAEDNNQSSLDDAKQLAAWNPYDQNAVASFFDSEWMFGITGGFDIVIGNPPFISTKGISQTDKKKYEAEFGFSDDTYNLFTFKGMSLCKDGGSLTFIIPKTFWTTQTKENMRQLLLSHTLMYVFDSANPFESVMVDTCIIQVIKTPFTQNHEVKFLDGTTNLSTPIVYTPIKQSMFIEAQNKVIFKPTPLNLRIYKLYNAKVKQLHCQWWEKIKTSRAIAQNQEQLEEYRASLKPGDVALLGCLTDGGQGLATANNGKYIAVRCSTKWADSIKDSRPKKLAEAIKKYKFHVHGLDDFANTKEFLNSLTEHKIAALFDQLKESYGRDIFGRGYLYKIINDDEIADVDNLTQDEKDNGIDSSKKFYVPYDKGDKDGNRWFLETPFAIAWSKENVHFLKTDPRARYQGYKFYFREGLCWSDINTTYLKCRKKSKSIHDVKSMSVFGLCEYAPEEYLLTLINSTFISLYVDVFVNNTQTFQINDARQLPVIIPTQEQIIKAKSIVHKAITTKKASDCEKNLESLQKEVDKFVLNIYGL